MFRIVLFVVVVPVLDSFPRKLNEYDAARRTAWQKDLFFLRVNVCVIVVGGCAAIPDPGLSLTTTPAVS